MNIQNVDCKSILPSLYCIDLETNQPTNQPANRPSMSFLSVLVHWIQRMLHWNKSEKKSSHSIQPQILFPTLVLSSFLSFLFVCLFVYLFVCKTYESYLLHRFTLLNSFLYLLTGIQIPILTTGHTGLFARIKTISLSWQWQWQWRWQFMDKIKCVRKSDTMKDL